ncbi:hypothetical protein MBLNU457_1459t2 [Dothideomycetes sp. NU457]
MNTDTQTAETIRPLGGQDPQPPVLQRASLTRTNLKRFEKMKAGRKTATATATETVSSSTKSTNTTTSKGFGPQLSENGVIIYRKYMSKGPVDLSRICDTLEGTRESPCSSTEFEYYRRQVNIGHTENKTQSRLWTTLTNICDRGDGGATQGSGNYTDYFNHAWSQLDNQITAGISPAKPDIAEAFRASSFPRHLDDVLPELFPAGPSDFAMPSFAVELKNAEVGLFVADFQCAYDGALMVHAAMKAHEYMYGSSASAMDSFWNTTKAITIAFDGRNLNIFAHYAALNPDPNPEWEDDEGHRVLFHQYALKQMIITSDFEAYKKGKQLIRNAQDLGYELNSDLRRQLYEHRRRTKLKARAPANAQSNAPPSPASDKSSDHPRKRAKIAATEKIVGEASKEATNSPDV